MPATKLTKSAGDRQRERVSTVLTNPIVVTVLDASDLPFAGTTVTFAFQTVPQGAAGHKLNTASVPVDVVSGADGKASVAVTLGDTEGEYVVTATAAGLTGSPATFTLTGVPANAIVSLDIVKTYLKVDGLDTTRDDFLQDVINMVSDAIERFIQGPVVAQDFAGLIYDGTGKQELSVREWPIISLLNNAADDVQYRETPADSWLTLEATKEYIILKRETPWKVKLWRLDFPEGDANIKLNLRCGYEDVPSDIELVCIEEVALVYKESSAGNEGRLGRESANKSSGGVGGTDTFTRLTDEHLKILRRYRHMKP